MCYKKKIRLSIDHWKVAMLAREIMTANVVSVYENAVLAQAVDLMLKLKVSGLPVVDTEGQLVGILSEGDLMRRIELDTEPKRSKWLEFLLGPGRLAEDYVKTHARHVKDVMTKTVCSVGETTPVGEVVSTMNAHHVKRVPVVRDGKPVGIISRADLVRALGRVLDQPTTPPAVSDADLKDKIIETLRQNWAPNARISVQVHDGNVELRGILTDERQHDAIRVAVENIPGVKAIEDGLAYVDVHAGVFF